MDPNEAEDLLRRRGRRGGKRRVKAILPVHLYGHPSNMDPILDLASRYHLTVIEDACQAHGADYRGKRVGSLRGLGCFSFYPTKNLGGYGDGGMVVTDRKEFHEKLRLWRCYGEKKKYHHVLKGRNSRLDEIQAAILRVKLRYLDRWNQERRAKAKTYGLLLGSVGVTRPVEKEYAYHVYHLYVIRTKRRNELQAFLKERGIDTLIHYPIPIHLQRAFRDLGYRQGDFPTAERSSREVLSLPFFPEITDPEMEEVVDGIRSFEDMPSGREGRSVQRTRGLSRGQTETG
jgi:dTDP-4-amino-4,6-dideoxygalactose transaminase